MKKLISYLRSTYFICKNFSYTFAQYFMQGYRAKLLGLYCKSFFTLHLQQFSAKIKKERQESESIQHVRYCKLRQLTEGLHKLLPLDNCYSYSILIIIPDFHTPANIQKTIEAALNQTAPDLEIIVGYPKHILLEIDALLDKIPTSKIIKKILLSSEEESQNWQELISQSTGNFIFPLLANDWIRPDFIYRCEQLLRLIPPSELTCIYTDEFCINELDYPILNSQWQKPTHLYFPYVFKDEIGHSLLIPRSLWLKAGGIQIPIQSNGLWELACRLNLQNARFYHLPFPLYAHRKFPSSISSRSSPIFNHSHILLRTLEAYSQAKNLNWTWIKKEHSWRAIPAIEKTPLIQIIIPFKDQKKITLEAVQSALHQTGVRVKITAIDNCSQDLTIAQQIGEWGGEVLSIAEPFNFSRLNNLAVHHTQTAQDCEYLLFLNNDVIIEKDAVEEMCRWISQPNIGMVGCLLCYPNQLVQHCGVDLQRDGPSHKMTWVHTEKMKPLHKAILSQTARITDAVTAACALIRRSTFLEIGGFDETWYPIAYSDTNLAVKLQSKGLHCFYTPYAKGVHHESVSRAYENIEDVENSSWLHRQYITKILQ